MSSYYREHVSFPNVTSGPAPHYPPPVTAANNVAHNFPHARTTANNDAHATSSAEQSAQDDARARHCSVKGCAAPLPPRYPHKMCDECRGRHRIYATTKRAKRKMEKALINNNVQPGQPVVWMPDDENSQHEHEVESVAGPSRTYEPPQVPPLNEENAPPFDFSQGWDPRALDPRLFSHTSELAGALTLPHTQHHPSEHDFFGPNDPHMHQSQSPSMQPQQSDQQEQQQQSMSHPASMQAALHIPQQHYQHAPQAPQNPGPPPPPPAPEIHPVLAEVLKAVPNLNLNTRITSGPTVPVSNAVPPVDGQLPPRFCSIKGCKTLIAGNSFFKMCEPCRNRYRNYGTTKRAKWRKEKEVAVQEMHKLREEEDKRRAEQGLPPLPPLEDEIWHEYDVSPTESSAALPGPAGPSSGTAPPTADGKLAPRPPRMCTVSHCREILPGDYQFLRCERHRIQNRHHSKLKRVRDKEVKAQVYDGWAAAAGVRATSTASAEDGQDDEHVNGDVDPDAQVQAQMHAHDLPLELDDIERHLRGASMGPDYTGPHIVAESNVSATMGANEQLLEETPLGEPIHGVPPAARGTRRTNHVCSIKACANLLSPSNPWKMCDLCRSRDRAGRRLKAFRDSGLIPPEVAEGKIEKVKMEVEGRARSVSMAPAVDGEKRPKKKKKKSDKGEKGEKADVGEGSATDPSGAGQAASSAGVNGMSGIEASTSASSGPAVVTIAPEALQKQSTTQNAGTSASAPSALAFNNTTHAGQGGIVFMNPLSPEEAAKIQTRYVKISDLITPIPVQPPAPAIDEGQTSAPQQESSTTQVSQNSAPAQATAPTASPKKRGKGKGKGKAKANTDQAAPDPQPPPGDASAQANPSDASGSANAPAPPAPGMDPSHTAPPPYASPPNGYPFFMQPPPYMTPYPPPNYAYPYSPPKGPYAPPPPMYQTPYGAYPYGYPHPGQPFGYPGAPYPPPGQPYPPMPPGQGYPPPMQTSPQPGQAYPPPPQAFGYPHPYPLPPNYQSPPLPPQPPPQPPPPDQAQDVHAPQDGHTSQDQQQQQQQQQQQEPQISHPPEHPPSPPLPPQQQQQQQEAPPVVAAAAAAEQSSDDTSSAISFPSHPSGPPPDANASPAVNQSTSYTDPGRQRFGTFIVRTEETYQNGYNSGGSSTNGSRSAFGGKRKREDGDADFENACSKFRVDLSVGAGTSAGQNDVSASTTHEFPAVPAAVERAQCSKKSCKRLLPVNTSGSLCDRCKERLKKKQAQAKFRFKLEPKSLVKRPVGTKESSASSVTDLSL
ncbi:hypothetical protein C8Q73DRAFT_687934 [Cubamyces lactineus]|nr:hypothetical protein C8Q73DRAFT_687934 [Cubamyces lactineus]